MSRRTIGGLAVIGVLAFALTALAGGVPLGGSSPTATAQVDPDDPQPPPFPDNPQPPPPEQRAEVLEGEAALLHEFLRFALGRAVPCPLSDTCSINTDFVSVVDGALERCAKIGPGEKRAEPDYADSPRFRAAGNLFDAACRALAAPNRATTPVADTPEWRAAAERAVEVLDASTQPRP